MKKIKQIGLILGIIILFPFVAKADTDPTVITLAATNIQNDSVVLNGYVKRNPGGGMILLKGFAYKKDTETGYSYVSINEIDTFSFQLHGLHYNSLYSFKTIAITTDSIYEGEELFFTTDDPYIPTRLETLSASSITSTEAQLNGAMIELGRPEPNEIGFIMGNSPVISLASTRYVIGSPSVGNYGYLIDNLNPSTTYYYAIYSISDADTIIGETKEFTTTSSSLTLPEIISYPPINIDTSSARLIAKINNIGSGTISSRGFEYKESSSNDYIEIIINNSIDSMVYDLQGLTPSTDYIIIPFVNLSGYGKVYGIGHPFRTDDKPYEFTTLAAEDIGSRDAIIKGIINKADLMLQKYGFYFREGDDSYGVVDLTETIVLDGETIISFQMGNLKPYTDYTYKVFGLSLADFYEGDEITFRTNTEPMVVSTLAATDITSSSAKLNGNIVDAGSPKLIEKGFILSENVNTLSLSSNLRFAVSGSETGQFEANTTVLNDNTEYYTRVYSISELDTVFGVIHNFKTLSSSESFPNPILSSALDISDNSAKINLSLSGSYSPSLSDIGLEYKTGSEDNYSYISFEAGSSSNTYTINLSNLEANTLHQYRAKLVNSNNTIVYSEEKEFKTLTIPARVITNQASDIDFYSAKLNGEVYKESDIVFFRGFEFRRDDESSYERIYLDEIEVLEEVVDGLDENTTYWYRTFAKNENGFVYGDSVWFTTLAILPPTINNPSVSSVTKSSAKFSGSFEEGSFEPITQAFLIKKWGEEVFTSTDFEGSSYSFSIDTLTEGTTYYFATYILTEKGAYISDIMEVKTLGEHNVGLEDEADKSQSINFYPNPAKDHISISMDNIDEEYTLIISDISGRKLIETKIVDKITTIDVSGLSSSAYVIRIIGHKTYFVDKLIIR